MSSRWSVGALAGLVALALLARVGAQEPAQAAATRALQSPDAVWTAAPERAQIADRGSPARTLTGPSAIVRLDKTALDAIFAAAPPERGANDELVPARAGAALTLPMPDGSFARFAIVQSPILVPELAALFPDIRTFVGAGLDDPTATVRLDWTERGFHAMVLSESGTVYVDPYTPGDVEYYVAFRKADLQGRPAFVCLLDETDPEDAFLSLESPLLAISNGATLRTYRLALAATGEYTADAGGTRPLALSRMTTTINRVNGIYERELAVRLTLLTGPTSDPTALIYTAGATDPYTNTSPSAMISENQTNVTAVMMTAPMQTPFDVGHVFGTAGGGLATLNSPCTDSIKARGMTGSPSPTGEVFDVDLVAHELGHQFGGPHTFNGTTSNCVSPNRSPANAYEPGSGSTIQAYAGICADEDLQRNSHDYFHVSSLDRMRTFITSAGDVCGTDTPTGNAVPTLTVTPDTTVPSRTPFALTASGSDANGDALTYTWEQFDLGTASTSAATASTDDGSRPLFRSYPPSSAQATRTFPALPYVLNNAGVPPQTFTGTSPVSVTCSFGTCLTGEAVPTFSRTAMRFVATVRDARAGGGAFATSLTTLMVDGALGPFQVTSPDTAVTITGNAAHNVTWEVNGTAALAANVAIRLSTDGGQSFPTVLSSSTANDGSESVVFPNTPSTTARIRIEAVGSIFFDISNTNFTLQAGANTAPTISDVANQATDEDTSAGPIAFTVGDAETPGLLTMTASSSDTALVPNGNITLGGTGASRTVAVMPASNQSGSATITLTVSDGIASASSAFLLTVTAVNDPPTIVPIPSQTVTQGALETSVAITIADVDTPAASLTLSGVAANQTLLPSTAFTFSGGGTSRTLAIRPVPGQAGATSVTITVSDGAATAATSFTATVVDDVPQNLAVSVSGSTASFTWGAPGATATDYVLIARGSPAGPVIARVATGSAATSFSVAAPSGTYYVTVAAIVAGTERGESNQVGLAIGFAPAPTSVTTTATSSSFGVRWSHSVLAGSRTGYQIRVGTRPGLSDQAVVPLPSTATSFDTSSVIASVPFGRYYVTVEALPSGGASRAPEVVAAVGTPPVLTRSGPGLGTLTWTASGVPTSFRLEVGFAPGTTAFELPLSGTSFAIPAGAAPGTYFVRVAAVYALGNSLASNEIAIVIPSLTDAER